MLRKLLFGPILLGPLPLAASAADTTPADHGGLYIGPVLDVGLDFGGDKVGTVQYTDGSQQDINIGDGGLIAGGVHLRPYRDSPFDLKATVGYKYTTSQASNADIHLSRLTYELTPNVRLPHGIWAGIGVVHQSAINFSGDGIGPDLNFKDATGANFELGWRSRARAHADYGVAAVYTVIDYRDEFGNRYNANSIGLRFTANFGWTVFGHAPAARLQPQIAVVPAEVPPPVAEMAVPAPAIAPPMTTALAKGQSVKLPVARNLRRQPREASPYSSALPAGTTVTLDSQIGDFWFVQAAGAVGWLRTDELR